MNRVDLHVPSIRYLPAAAASAAEARLIPVDRDCKDERIGGGDGAKSLGRCRSLRSRLGCLVGGAKAPCAGGGRFQGSGRGSGGRDGISVTREEVCGARAATKLGKIRLEKRDH